MRGICLSLFCLSFIMNISIDDDWFTISLESKLNKRMDDIEQLLHQNMKQLQVVQEEIKTLQQTIRLELDSIKQSTERIQSLSEEIGLLKHSHDTIPSRQELIEELRMIQQRELNLMLREKRATPFISSKSKTIML